MRTTALLLPLLLLALAPSVHAGHGDDLVQASLVADTTTIQPGQTFRIGVLLQIDPGWHIYWTNPGDSGLPTRVKLNLPAGFVAGDVEYPMPMRINLPGDIINYAYENQVMLIVPVTAPKEYSSQTAPINADIRWLVCQDVCLPGKTTASLDMPVGGNSSATNVELFSKWSKLIPDAQTPLVVAKTPTIRETLPSNGQVPKTKVDLKIQWNVEPETVEWFPGRLDGAQISDVSSITHGNVTDVSFLITGSSTERYMLHSVIEYKLHGGQQQAWDYSIPLGGPHK